MMSVGRAGGQAGWSVGRSIGLLPSLYVIHDKHCHGNCIYSLKSCGVNDFHSLKAIEIKFGRLYDLEV